MADGNIYYQHAIHVQSESGTDVVVDGSAKVPRDLMTLHNVWMPKTQMCQVAPGHRWCSCCGDVRPLTYFDPVAWDERGKATGWDMKGKPTAWDGVPYPTAWHPECKQCVNAHDPKLRPMKYCPACKMDHSRVDFGDDERNTDGKKSICKAAAARDERQRYAKIRQQQGHEVDPYSGSKYQSARA